LARLPLLQNDSDFQGFERVLGAALNEYSTRLLGYCLITNCCQVLGPGPNKRPA